MNQRFLVDSSHPRSANLAAQRLKNRESIEAQVAPCLVVIIVLDQNELTDLLVFAVVGDKDTGVKASVFYARDGLA
ncbi:hypothetical protein H7100_01625 [Candidatus Saccharibacteria bacterium]|nr:hypothetical protein [Candidatus Saccharibacteria bacterium]